MELGTDRVLITGAAGWLGRGLLSAILTGLPECGRLSHPWRAGRVRALVLPGQEETVRTLAPEAEVRTGDLCHPDACRSLVEDGRGGVLFHLAGIIHPRRVRELYDVNVTGTRNILAAAANAGVRRAVVVSSNSPFGCNPHRDHRFDAESPYRPYLAYGRSKMLMERLALGFQERGSLEIVLCRAPWFYGPFQPLRQSTFFRMVRDGRAPIVGGGENLRSMAYLDNLSQGLLLAAAVEKAAGQALWVADERPYSMNEIVDTIERLLETEFGETCRHRRLRLPGLASRVAYGVDWALQRAGFYKQEIHVLSEMNKTIACSVEKTHQELGYAPTVELEEGMRRSIRWAIGEGHLAG